MVSSVAKKNVKTEDYKTISDELIVSFYNDGDIYAQEYLIRKYKSLVIKKARTYFLVGGDSDDIIQEGMIGLFKAIRDFDKKKNSNFVAFADLCIKRQIITAITAATRQKHGPLNSSVSLDKPIFENESEVTLLDVLSDENGLDPETLVIANQEISLAKEKMGEVLSKFELSVLKKYLDGASYIEIAFDLDKPDKAIDNALQRIKKKLELYNRKISIGYKKL